MLKTLNYKFGMNLIKKKEFMNIIRKNITVNYNNNYLEPSDKEEEIEDVKNYLNKENPKYLCIYFTNNWNPIAKMSNPLYSNFTSKTGSFRNLRIFTDDFPRLKWYFDSKSEPGFHFYYHGSLISKIGGSNYEKALTEIKRIQNSIDSDFVLGNNNASNILGYAQPYYDFESKLATKGVENSLDPGQTMDSRLVFLLGMEKKKAPYEENFVHKRYRK